MAHGSERALVFDDQFISDVRYWLATDPRIAARIFMLVEAIRRDPFRGVGKPEPLNTTP